MGDSWVIPSVTSLTERSVYHQQIFDHILEFLKHFIYKKHAQQEIQILNALYSRAPLDPIDIGKRGALKITFLSGRLVAR